MTMLLISAVVTAVLVLLVGGLLYRFLPRRLKTDLFFDDWKDLQAYCRDKTTWPTAVIAADKLLDKALKKRKYKGKRMGERMVSAQRDVTNNDQLWFAHNLAKKIIADPAIKLKEADVKSALMGFRQALRDLGALETSQQNEEKPGAKS